MNIKDKAKELCNESGCHHKCKNTKDCVVEDEAELLISNNSQCIDCIHNEICQFYKAMGITVICYPCGFYKANTGYRKQSEWISVEDRLPEVAQRVLLFSPSDGINLGYVTEDKRFYVYKSYPDRPTHWMPLPEAPKMKGGAE